MWGQVDKHIREMQDSSRRVAAARRTLSNLLQAIGQDGTNMEEITRRMREELEKIAAEVGQ